MKLIVQYLKNEAKKQRAILNKHIEELDDASCRVESLSYSIEETQRIIIEITEAIERLSKK